MKRKLFVLSFVVGFVFITVFSFLSYQAGGLWLNILGFKNVTSSDKMFAGIGVAFFGSGLIVLCHYVWLLVLECLN
jgi:hypothetical protein